MERFDTWGLCVPSFALVFLPDFLPSCISSCLSKFCSPNVKYFHAMHTDELYSMCTVNLILLCHIRTTAHVHILCCIVNVQKVWCLFKTVCSCMRHFTAHAHYFFMANSWLQYAFLLLPSCYPQGDNFHKSCFHSGPLWRTVCCMLSRCNSPAGNTVWEGCRLFWAFIKTWVSAHELQKNLGPTADPEIFENLYHSVCSSVCSAICFEQKIK